MDEELKLLIRDMNVVLGEIDNNIGDLKRLDNLMKGEPSEPCVFLVFVRLASIVAPLHDMADQIIHSYVPALELAKPSRFSSKNERTGEMIIDKNERNEVLSKIDHVKETATKLLNVTFGIKERFATVNTRYRMEPITAQAVRKFIEMHGLNCGDKPH